LTSAGGRDKHDREIVPRLERAHGRQHRLRLDVPYCSRQIRIVGTFQGSPEFASRGAQPPPQFGD